MHKWLLRADFILGLNHKECQLKKNKPEIIDLNTIESAVHALQQQQSGASAQLSVFNEKLDIMEERIGQRIANALQERNTNPVQPMYRGKIKIPREVSVGCSDRRYLAF